jgi:DNA polymerase-3 subunit delta'
MDWTTFIGHSRQRTWFSNAIRHHRLASTFLFVGPDGIGKRTFARLLAKTLLCTESDPVKLAPCCQCETCAQVEAGTHPDVIDVHRGKENANLSMEQLVGKKEARMREGLCYELRMRPYSGRRKIAIVDDVDTLAVEGANSLLKTLEEPPIGSLIFLIGTSEQHQLPTIRSRSQVVRFSPLAADELALLIERLGMVTNRADALRIARDSHGSIESARQAMDESMSEFRTRFHGDLIQRPIDFPRLSKSIVAHLDSVASEGQPRRDRLKWVFDAAIDLYRESMRHQLGLRGSEIAASAAGCLASAKADTMASLIRRTQEAREQVDRNISPAPILEAWSADIANLCGA